MNIRSLEARIDALLKAQAISTSTLRRLIERLAAVTSNDVAALAIDEVAREVTAAELAHARGLAEFVRAALDASEGDPSAELTRPAEDGEQ